MFVLTSNISIGKFTNVKVNDVKIYKSVFDFIDRAIIKIPTTAMLKQSGKSETSTVETAKQFAEGDKALIYLGYDGINYKEFEGFVSRINFTEPCEIEFEGYSYQLRKTTIQGTLYNHTLLSLLQIIIAGTDIILDTPNIPEFIIDKIVFDKCTGVEALEKVKRKSNNIINISFQDNLLSAGLAFISTGYSGDVKYKMRWNVIKDGNLKYRIAKNQDCTIIAIGVRQDGSQINVTSGNTGEKITVTTHNITDRETLQNLADSERAKRSYNGYEGKITAFITPYCEPGYRCILEDTRYQERNGHYLIDSVEVSYGRGGARRSVGIGRKLN